MKPEIYKLKSDLMSSTETGKVSHRKTKGRGAVYTRLEVVDSILDLVGYSAERSLSEMRILEPSFGSGSFLVSIIERLIQSYKNKKKDLSKVEIDLENSVRAVELHEETFQKTRNNIIALLEAQGLTKNQSVSLVNSWLICGDFLLKEFKEDFTHVVGNPPYVRQELIASELIRQYRKLFKTIFDRADIYIPFIEKSLSLLEKEGTLGFICSDRWIKNRYGQPLRQLINEKFFLKFHIDMNETEAFHSDVIAYPAITVIQNAPPGKTRVLSYSEIQSRLKTQISEDLPGFRAVWKPDDTLKVTQIKSTNAPWILHSNSETKLIQRLENQFPNIELTNCKVGIGVATGADKVYIDKFDQLNVEESRKLPIVMTRDIKTDKVIWHGYGVVNPFEEDGSLVSLKNYPKLKDYFDKHQEMIKQRNVAKRNPNNWYKTIDRIYPKLTKTPKLLIPDIKGEAYIVFEEGKYYPHHNLYYITSEEWDLRALQAVLLSGIAKLFVSAYSTKMRGGFLRFQAQYLRRIRVPYWKHINDEQRLKLVEAAQNNDHQGSRILVSEIYGLKSGEIDILEEISAKKEKNSK